MKLGIVGHAAEKFTPHTEGLARLVIREAIRCHNPTHVVSGRSPMGGVDVWAEEIAADLGLPTRIYAPRVHTWDGLGGFRDRNLDIARDSDVVLVVVVKTLPESFTGVRFPACYHCKGRNPEHVKSGGCWTAWKAIGAGKKAEWKVVEEGRDG